MIHLVCNAHLDPLWLWEWQEGAAEALSTFKIAADFCEEYGEFVFCHNEAVLYEWVQEHDAELFKRIQKLVAQGKWHIMGGWYLQPDVIMPSGESIARQILIGRKYFADNFASFPKTAVNVDSFGHSRGLVQLLTKSGFNSYVRTRPSPEQFPSKHETFEWIGYDNSSVLVNRSFWGYLSLRGEAAKKTKAYIEENKEQNGMVFWGVGNHGGGPSRIDLEDLEALKKEIKDYELQHSTPEAYFDEFVKTHDMDKVEKFATGIGLCFRGCYISQSRIKVQHRLLENELYSTEKMISAACVQGLLDYPKKELDEATKDLLFSEFHDVLPGSGIMDVEEKSLQRIAHGLEILARLKFKAFIKLINKKPELLQGELPLYVYNPHPYQLEATLEAEYQMADQNWANNFTFYHLYDEQGNSIPCQVIKERCNLSLDWRKRVTFRPTLNPMSMNVFVLKPYMVDQKPVPNQHINANGDVEITNDVLKVVISSKTGLIDTYEVNGVSYLKQGALSLSVMQDDAESWGTNLIGFDEKVGEFTLKSKKDADDFACITNDSLAPVRVIEDGEVKTVVEAILEYNYSHIVVNYHIPTKGSQIEVKYRVYWLEKEKCLKLDVPTTVKGEFILHDMCGIKAEEQDATEKVGQKWCGMFGGGKAVTLINNGPHGFDCKDGQMRVSMLRSPAYSSLYLGTGAIGSESAERPLIYPDRFHDRQEQGLRQFSFWLNASDEAERKDKIAKEVVAVTQPPYAMAVFAAANKTSEKPLYTIDDENVEVMAFKKAENSDDYVVRLFEATGKARKATFASDVFGVKEDIEFAPFEVKTFFVNKGKFEETDLIEGICVK